MACRRRDDPAAEASRVCHVAEAANEAARVTAVKLRTIAQLHVEVPEDLPPVLASDRRLVQVLINLLINAGDAVEANGRPGHIRLVAALAGGGCELSVEDDGPGLSPEVLARLFEPFHTTKGPARGTGLGLALAREFMVQAGRNMRAENRPDGGARFTLWLPCATAELAAVS